MQCQNCKKETSGLKVNGKIFCTNCGEEIINIPEVTEDITEKNPNPEPTVSLDLGDLSPKVISAEGDIYEKVIEDEEREIDILNAEKKVIDLILDKSESGAKEKIVTEKPQTTDNKTRKAEIDKEIKNTAKKPKIIKIVKHHRPRADKIIHFDTIAGEPNPVKNPELPAPHDTMIETKKETKGIVIKPEPEPVVPVKSADSTLLKQQAMRDFFRKGLVETPKKRKIDRKKARKIQKIIFIASSTVTLLAIIIGFLIYANSYISNPKKAVSEAEKRIKIAFNKPTFIPAGFEASYLTKAEENIIEYVYEYKPDPKKSLSIIAKGSDLTKDAVYSDVVLKKEGDFNLKNINETEVWLIGEKTAVFLQGGVLYEVSFSEPKSEEELLQIVEGII